MSELKRAYILDLSVALVRGDYRLWSAASKEEQKESRDLLVKAGIIPPPPPVAPPAKRATKAPISDFHEFEKVTLKNGGPVMTFEYIDDRGKARCTWFENERWHVRSFAVGSLVRPKPTPVSK